MIALDEQHLEEVATLFRNSIGIVFHLDTGHRRLGAGGNMAAVDPDDADTTAAMRREFRIVAQVRNVLPGTQRGIHDGIAFLESD